MFQATAARLLDKAKKRLSWSQSTNALAEFGMDAETMYNYEALAKRARYYKPGEKGVAAMCKIMED